MLAQQEAEHGGQSYIGTEHLLLGLMSRDDGLGHAALTTFGVHLAAMRAALETVARSSEPMPIEQIIPTSRVKRIIELCFEIARRENSAVVDTGHMLLAIVEEGNGIAAQVLRERGVTAERLKSEITHLRQAGRADSVRTQAMPSKYQRHHLDLQGVDGKPIAVDVLFPADYSDQQCRAMSERIRDAVEGRPPG